MLALGGRLVGTRVYTRPGQLGGPGTKPNWQTHLSGLSPAFLALVTLYSVKIHGKTQKNKKPSSFLRPSPHLFAIGLNRYTCNVPRAEGRGMEVKEAERESVFVP